MDGSDGRSEPGATNRPTADAGHTPENPDHVLLVMADGRDRALLADWLRESGRYVVTTCDPDGSPEEGYDLCLLDARGLDRCRETVRRHRDRADPVFLPAVLLTTDPPADAGPVVDDVVELPVDQGVLHRRVENLLRSRRASVRLSERENQYRRLVELAPEAILLVRAGSIRYANAAAEMLDVADTAALDGRDVASFGATDEDAATLESTLSTVESEGSVGFHDVRLRSAAGRTVDAQVAGVAVTDDGDPAVQLVVRDVTAERRREQRLTLFGRAVEATAQGVTIADAQQDDLPLVYANAAFERITGYDAEEILGRNCRFLQGDGTDEARVAELRDAIESERAVTTELLNYRKDGTAFWNRLEIVPIADDEGTVTHFLGLQRDVTERREREERLSVMDRVLRHNIRNRVNVIQGYAESLAHEGDWEKADRIRAAATDLLRISDQVRRFQSLISERTRTLSTHDLAAMLDRIIEGVRETYPAADVRFVDGDPAPAAVHRGLPGAIEELFELAVAPDPAAADLTVTVTADTEVVVEVVDHGGTIPTADLRAIVEERETPLRHSSGLELWLVRWAVLYSDGELTVEAGDPARIVMRFPLAD